MHVPRKPWRRRCSTHEHGERELGRRILGERPVELEHAAGIRSPHSIVALFQIEGALNRIEAGRSATGNRDARYVVNVAGSWEQPGDDKVNIAWAREAWSDIKMFSTGGSYINFLTEDESPERIAAALGKSLDRLAEIKAAWDPQNVFRTNRNIPPAARLTSAGER